MDKEKEKNLLERTLVLIKPDGVQRGLIGSIISRFEQRGLKVIGLKMMWVEEDFAKRHYAAHKEKQFFKGLVEFITSGPIVAMAIEGINAVEYVRKIVGSTEPQSSAVGTIRGDFAHVSYHYADKKRITIKNLIHASGTAEEATEEIELWFNISELFEYETVHEKFVF